MSIQAVSWVLDQDAELLPGKAKLVLVSIANHADHTDGYCWLKLETISRESSMPIRSLYRYIGALVRNGYLRKSIRKGTDGKTRATDYWILFNRTLGKWDWGASVHEDDDPQDVVEASDQSAMVADGESGQETQESAAVADGPSAIGGTGYKADSSKTNPSKREDARESLGYTPRAYRPPPPQPMGAVIADKDAKQIFVFEGTRAWEAWVAYKTRTKGVPWNLSTSHFVDGKSRRGWWFPSLFPPTATVASSTDPPSNPLMTEEDLKTEF